MRTDIGDQDNHIMEEDKTKSRIDGIVTGLERLQVILQKLPTVHPESEWCSIT